MIEDKDLVTWTDPRLCGVHYIELPVDQAIELLRLLARHNDSDK